MNRYPVWKYAILVIVLLVGALYTLPNFFGEAPAVQVSSAKATVKVDAAVLQRVEEVLKTAGVTPAALRASSTRCCTAESTLMVALADDTCTAGASPKKLGRVYKAPTSSTITRIAYFQTG